MSILKSKIRVNYLKLIFIIILVFCLLNYFKNIDKREQNDSSIYENEINLSHFKQSMLIFVC